MARKQGSHSDITGPKVRAAALRLIAQDGYAAVSMRRIAGEVGIQAGALYNYTSDKQSLLFDLLHRHMEELLEAVAQAGVHEGDALTRLDAFTRFHIGFHLVRRDAVFISYMELRNLTDENFARIEAMRHAYEDLLEDILCAGVAENLFDLSDTRLTTMALIALLTGVTNWYKEGGRIAPAELQEIYVDLVRKAVGAGPIPALAAQ